MQLHLPQGCTAQHSVLTLTDNTHRQTDRQTDSERERQMDSSTDMTCTCSRVNSDSVSFRFVMQRDEK